MNLSSSTNHTDNRSKCSSWNEPQESKVTQNNSPVHREESLNNHSIRDNPSHPCHNKPYHSSRYNQSKTVTEFDKRNQKWSVWKRGRGLIEWGETREGTKWMKYRFLWTQFLQNDRDGGGSEKSGFVPSTTQQVKWVDSRWLKMREMSFSLKTLSLPHSRDDSIVLLYTNDWHGWCENEGRVVMV